MLYYKSVLFGSLALLTLGVGMGFIGFPCFLKHKIKSDFTLTPGGEIRQTWEKFPFAINFNVYVFNITNPIQAQNGEKVVVEEIGPFVFEYANFRFQTKFQLFKSSVNGRISTISRIMKNRILFPSTCGIRSFSTKKRHIL